MRSMIRTRTALLVLVSWVSANALLYFGIEWLEAPRSPSKRNVSRQVLAAYVASPNSVVRNGEQTLATLPYRLMSPENVKPKERYPLVVFLHGSGQKGDDNQIQLWGLPEQMAEATWRTQFPCFLLAPQCPEQSSWSNVDGELIGLIRDVMSVDPIDPERVYLTGFSMGGFGCWTLVAKKPNLFAAVVPICGGGDPKSAEQLIDVPIWAVHGDADSSVSVEQSRTMIAAIRKAGGQPNYTELKGIGHDSWTQTYRNTNGVLKWMFEQRRRRDATQGGF